MEFLGKDLEDIQRVAGLLNLTVDELLQQSRSHSQNQNATHSPAQILSPQLGLNPQGQALFPEDQVPSTQHHPPLDLDLDAFDLDLDTFDLDQVQSRGSGSEPPAPRHQDTRRILLNPPTTWYSCDSLWGFNQSPGEIPDFDDVTMGSEPTGEGSDYVRVSEMDDHASASQPGQDDSLRDWAIVSPPPESSAFRSPRSSSGSTDQRYPKIAPRDARANPHSASDTSSSRVKKPRSRYDGIQRVDTHLTRQLHACVRCRMQRNRVRCDPSSSTEAPML